MDNTLKVYGEDLINAAINASTVSGDKVLAAGNTQGGLCVNVFAKTAVTTAAAVTITVKHADSASGEFATLDTITIAADKSYGAGDLIASIILPQTTKAFVSAAATSNSSNTGSIRVTLGYLAR